MPHEMKFGNPISVAPLRGTQIGQAFPLVREVAPSLMFEQWIRIASPLTREDKFDRRGILAATVASGHLYGLCLYRVEPLKSPKPLVAHYLATFGIGQQAPVARSLVAAIDSLAFRLGCEIIQTSVASSQRSVRACLEAAGHRIRQVEFSKYIGDPEDDQMPARYTDLSWLEQWHRGDDISSAAKRG